jgi:tetratricopeptide (TPR) repeat protein
MAEGIQGRTDGRRTIWLLTGSAFALGVLILIAGYRPSAVNWGVHSLGFLPSLAAIAVLLLLVCALIPPVQAGVITAVNRLFAATQRLSRRRRWALSIASLTCLAALLWIGRETTFLLGDGFLVIRSLDVVGRSGDIPASFPTAPLSAFVALQLLKLYTALHLAGAAMLAWQTVSVIAGVVSVCAIWSLSRSLWEVPSERLAGFCLLAAAGAAQLWFGYVETYPAAYAVLWIYVMVALRVYRGEMPLYLATCVYAALCLFHLGMSILLPSLVYLWVRDIRRNGLPGFVASLLPTAVLVLLLLWILNYSPAQLLATAVRDGAHYLPLFRSDAGADAYTLFSLWHVADVMNLFMFLAPFSLLMFGTFIVSVALPRSSRPEGWGFWYSLGFPAGLWLFANSFELGMSRDWDLAASFGMMVVAGALVIWHHLTEPGTGRQRVMVLMAVFTMALTGGWIGINASPTASSARFEKLLDPRLMSGGALADAYEELGGMLRDGGRSEDAVNAFAQCVAADSLNARRWVRLAGSLVATGRQGQALQAYTRAIALGTKDPLAYLDAGIVTFQLGRRDDGLALARAAYAMDTTSVPAALTLGTMLYQGGGNDSEALRWLQRAASLDPANADIPRRIDICRSRIESGSAH